MMKLWVCEMNYEASDTPDGCPHPWRYYIYAETAQEAEQKVHTDRAKRMDWPMNELPKGFYEATIVRTYECPSGIV